MQVRRSTDADRAAVFALTPRFTDGVASWREPAAVRSAVDGWVTGALAVAGEPEHAVLVADPGGPVVGFVTCGERTHFTGAVDGYVGELVVAEDPARAGVERALTPAAEQWVWDRGLAHRTLETGAVNTTARAFYGALGYRDADVSPPKRLG